MSLPSWLTSQITAAQATDAPDGSTWTAYVVTADGLTAAGGAHDREHAATYLDGLGRTGIVALSPGVA
jgi:hypothetical protein